LLTFHGCLGILTRFMDDITEQQFVLTTPQSVPLRGDIRWSKELADSGDKRLPVILVCHGFKAFKDWGPFPEIGRAFARNGFVSIIFNFSHNGIGEEPRKFVEHEKFAVNTFSLEIDDIKTVLDAVVNGGLPLPFLDPRNIFLIGHSRGGAVSIIAGKEDERVRGVAAWSTISRFNRYTDEQKQRWREKGHIQLHSVSEQKLFRISTALLDDIENNAERLDILKNAEHLGKPLLIVHGTADIPAKIEEAEQIYAVSDKGTTEFVRLEGAGHMYGAKHPYREASPVLEHVIDVTTHWIQQHLLLEE
jgi:alpha-beta hydrolase superfamily lysophospholipase